MSRNPHEPTDASRKLVQLHATIGTQQHVIADILGIDAKTLRKHYREELDQSMAKANAQVGGQLFKKATGYRDENGKWHDPDTSAAIFWMKTRAGWRETNHTLHGNDPDNPLPAAVSVDLSKLSTEALAELVAARDAAPKD
jgi:hypothetical protein